MVRAVHKSEKIITDLRKTCFSPSFLVRCFPQKSVTSYMDDLTEIFQFIGWGTALDDEEAERPKRGEVSTR